MWRRIISRRLRIRWLVGNQQTDWMQVSSFPDSGVCVTLIFKKEAVIAECSWMLTDYVYKEIRLLLTWSLGSLFGGRVFAFGLDCRWVQDTRGGAVFAEMFLKAFDGAIQLAGPDLEVDVHEICTRQKNILKIKSWATKLVKVLPYIEAIIKLSTKL